MAKITQAELDLVRDEWVPKAEKVALKLKELSNEANIELDKVADFCENFFDSANAIHTVGEKILDMLEENGEPNFDMLKKIHRSIHKAQHLSGVLRVHHLPSFTDIDNIASTLLNTLYVQFMNSDIVGNIFTTNTDKEREAAYVSLKCTEYTDLIRTRKKQLDSYIKFIDEQMYGLNRLDSMLKDSASMLDSEMFSKAGDSLPNRPTQEELDNEDAFADDSDVLDEGPDEVPTPKKSRRARKTDIDDGDTESVAPKPKAKKTDAKKMAKDLLKDKDDFDDDDFDDFDDLD